ncbi:uncharacterized protein CCDC197 [Ambystoma mexicanum]|uniref:uncharacterized protein CCDC197 n=1 Tax=Ambystoma mexicanum TaxID=8296 RepID=UPI0037E7EDC0
MLGPRVTMTEGQGLPVIQSDDPRYLLHLENKKRNVFVTQLGEGREDEAEEITCIPVIREPASTILDTSKNTLQKTLVLKKEVEFDDVSVQFLAKRQEFRERMEMAELRKSALATKQQDNSDKVHKFEQFVKDNNAKRRNAMQKYQVEVKQNEIKKRELEELTEELEVLKVRKKKLQKKISKYKTYEDYLIKLLYNLPENYLEPGIDAPLKAIITRHETLASTNQSLIDNLIALVDKQESSQRALATLQREHDTAKLMMNSELSQLYKNYDKIQDKNKQLEMNSNLSKGHFRYQSVGLAQLFLAVTNLAEQCYMHHYGPLEEVTLMSKLDMIKEYILEKMQVLQISRKLTERHPSVSVPKSQTQKSRAASIK